MAYETTNQTSVPVTLEARRITAAMAGVLLGVFLVYGVAFAAPNAIHNAAHDTRHAFTVPCH
jgi:cobalt transporter subunit CbtB